ncbi:hypothetical protein B296_00008538 [Ensete ventricosum]|uniref:Uncharacterized protein n=1 Tax=Ensete ventricosum TaxID=4639 RepID=A0A426ZE30_ENSVE|nr:hypothetical protein B296_00008538 [Ensete ventricosum]
MFRHVATVERDPPLKKVNGDRTLLWRKLLRAAFLAHPANGTGVQTATEQGTASSRWLKRRSSVAGSAMDGGLRGTWWDGAASLDGA